ncbi:MAG: hypothetical protein RL710_3024 [Pseudomonadota bacterium]|jgi:hypothetical protein
MVRVRHQCGRSSVSTAKTELSGLIASNKYFVLHAPRQTGKTSQLINLMHFINGQGRYRALYEAPATE